MSGVSRRHMLKELVQVPKNLQEILTTLTTRKIKVYELIQMMNPRVSTASTSQDVEHVVEKEAETSSEDDVHIDCEDGGNDKDMEYEFVSDGDSQYQAFE